MAESTDLTVEVDRALEEMRARPHELPYETPGFMHLLERGWGRAARECLARRDSYRQRRGLGPEQVCDACRRVFTSDRMKDFCPACVDQLKEAVARSALSGGGQ